MAAAVAAAGVPELGGCPRSAALEDESFGSVLNRLKKNAMMEASPNSKTTKVLEFRRLARSNDRAGKFIRRRAEPSKELDRREKEQCRDRHDALRLPALRSLSARAEHTAPARVWSPSPRMIAASVSIVIEEPWPQLKRGLSSITRMAAATASSPGPPRRAARPTSSPLPPSPPPVPKAGRPQGREGSRKKPAGPE